MVEKLFGGKMTVQSYEAELKQLVQPEAEKVFEAVRTKIMSTGAFDIKPPGIDGLVVLVKAQPGLQTRLMDFRRRCQVASAVLGLSAAGKALSKMLSAPPA
ncbi:hypothetical protein [Paludibacterium denitrificans]|uniref:hypothetical protein n=1 Tax=Paludibacterium denitrificans TaxID=2675226 RepID=UPI001E32580E|nr:hypothetical protein [Paludibacterium denitrificans]